LVKKGNTAKVTQKRGGGGFVPKGVLIANYFNLKPKKEFAYENPETIIPALIKSVHL
jgi:hypothetical protein